MRIVFLSPLGKIGGAEQCLLTLMGSLRAAVPDWDLFLIAGSPGPLLSVAREMGVHTNLLQFPKTLAAIGDSGLQQGSGRMPLRAFSLGIRLAAAALPALGYRLRLNALLDRIKPDVVHTNGLKMHILAAWRRSDRAALVWHIHDYVTDRPMMARVLRAAAPQCSMSIAISQSVEHDLRRLTDRLPVRTILNAIDVERFSATGSCLDLDKLSGMAPAPPGTLRIGLIATMARWKGHEVFLRALAGLPQREHVRAYVIGGLLYDTAGSQFDPCELQKLAEELGLRNVGFTGHVADTAAAMRSLDVVVHASTRPEPFGLVIAEALACGRAVIFSDGGGAAEVAKDHVTALAHRPGDSKGLAACLSTLIQDPSLRKKLGTSGSEEARRRFDHRRLATELIPLYRELSLRSAAVSTGIGRQL